MDNEPRPHRANDVWLSAGMVATIVSVVGSFVGLYFAFSNLQVSNENRLTRAEVKLEAITSDITELKTYFKDK